MPAPKFTIGYANGAASLVKNIIGGVTLKAKMIPLLMVAQRIIARSAKSNLRSRGKSSGKLARSIKTPMPRPTLLGVEAQVKVDSPYGRMVEEGGIIRPRHAKFLTVPLKKGMAPLRQINETFLIPTSGGWLAARRAGGGIEPLYALVTSVTMPARPFLAPALTQNRALITSLIGTGYIAAIRSAFR
jgi:hypothetical protein